jgi:hypothetical protein
MDYTQPCIERVWVGDNQTIVAGDLLCISSGKAVKASETVHTLVIGIAMQDITTTTASATDYINVLIINEKTVLRFTYDPGSKTSLAAADMFGTLFDIDADQEVNLDDTTNGFLLVVAYDNTNYYADCVVKASVLWNA